MLIHSPWRRILRRRDSFRIEDQRRMTLIVSRHVSSFGMKFSFSFLPQKVAKKQRFEDYKIRKRPFLPLINLLVETSCWGEIIYHRTSFSSPSSLFSFVTKKDSYLQDDSWAKGKEKGGRGVEGERFLSNPSPLFFTLSRRVATHLTSGNGHLLRSAYYFPDPIDRRGVFQPENYAIKQARIVREPRQRLLLATTMRTRNNRVWQSGVRRRCSRNYLSHRKIKQQFLV